MSSSDDIEIIEVDSPKAKRRKRKRLSDSETDEDSLIPSKSREKYLRIYQQFAKWRRKQKTRQISEDLFLNYFQDMAKSKLPSSLWSFYGMMKPTIQLKHGVDLKSYGMLTAFLKKQSEGYKSKISNSFSLDDIQKFLKNAPDDQYLMAKVALIMGVTGALRCQELCNIRTKDIVYHDDKISVKVRDIRTNVARTFVIKQEFFDIINKYHDLRPEKMPKDRFFLNYKDGKCSKLVIGRQKLGGVPRQIAEYLKKPDLDNYTGYCFRYSSGVMMTDSGETRDTIMDTKVSRRKKKK